jgi:hypothetical protein
MGDSPAKGSSCSIPPAPDAFENGRIRLTKLTSRGG